MTRTARLARVGLVLLLVVTLTSGSAFGVVGDSITSLARGRLEADGGVVRAFGGVEIRTGRPAIRRFVRYGPRRIVIALGTMDVARHASRRDIRRRITAVLRDDVAHVRCVIWVDLSESRTRSFQWTRRARQFNQILGEVARAYGRPVAHWSVLSAGHRNWFQDDGIHPTLRGRRWYAAMVKHNLEQRC